MCSLSILTFAAIVFILNKFGFSETEVKVWFLKVVNRACTPFQLVHIKLHAEGLVVKSFFVPTDFHTELVANLHLKGKQINLADSLLYTKDQSSAEIHNNLLLHCCYAECRNIIFVFQ